MIHSNTNAPIATASKAETVLARRLATNPEELSFKFTLAGNIEVFDVTAAPHVWPVHRHAPPHFLLQFFMLVIAPQFLPRFWPPPPC